MPPSRSPTIGRGTDGVCINNGRTVPGEKGNDSTGACDGQSEPDDAPKRPAKPILLPDGDQSEDDTGDAKDYNHPQA